MHRILLALTLAAAAPASAQDVIGENPVLESATTCAEFATMDSLARVQALIGIEPLGGTLAGADPAIARQWADAVAAACEGYPDRPLGEAAADALGAD